MKEEDKKAAGKLELANDLEAESKTFKEDSVNSLKEDFTNYDPSTAELERL